MFLHENSSSDLWDYKFPQQRFIPQDETIEANNEKYGGIKTRQLTRVVWCYEKFRVYFKTGDKERYVDITEECRAYCKAHKKRFTNGVREQLRKTLPEHLNIWVEFIDYYLPESDRDFVGMVYKSEANRDMLLAWFSELKF